jgi:Bacterial regulatory proteins, lacI family
MTARKTPNPVTPRPRSTLKMVANRVSLTAGTVCAVLNDTPACRSVPEQTKQRIFAAARELNYKPDFSARALRLKRTYAIGVIAAEIDDPYSSIIISGIERYLQQKAVAAMRAFKMPASVCRRRFRRWLRRHSAGTLCTPGADQRPPTASPNGRNGREHSAPTHRTGRRICAGHFRRTAVYRAQLDCPCAPVTSPCCRHCSPPERA